MLPHASHQSIAVAQTKAEQLVIALWAGSAMHAGVRAVAADQQMLLMLSCSDACWTAAQGCLRNGSAAGADRRAQASGRSQACALRWAKRGLCCPKRSVVWCCNTYNANASAVCDNCEWTFSFWLPTQNVHQAMNVLQILHVFGSQSEEHTLYCCPAQCDEALK